MTMCLSYSYVIYYLRRASELNFKKWDVSSVTTADFTVQVIIREEIWKCWKDAEASGNPPAKTFKEYIKRSMQDQLQTKKTALKGYEDVKIKVSTVFFAYNNGEIIDLLK